MDIEATEELVGSTTSNTDATATTHVAKGKRTRRHRPFPFSSPTLTNSSSSSASGDDHVSFNSSTTTTYDSTEEEEDMANCLILLAQGADAPAPAPAPNKQVTTTKFNNGFDVFECKTCNRTFPSFQALGGHRASHKKPKVEEKKPQLSPPQPPSPTPSPPPQVAIFGFEDAGEAQFKITPPVSLQLTSHNKASPSNKAKIHECSICGSEFTSGQALGGHMRRHRASTNNAAAAVEVKPRNLLELDLNLPAPEDDLRDSKFQFPPKQKSLVLSAPALVDCHY